MKTVMITTSWDDGHPLDLKLAELLNKYDIPATFYVTIDNVERESLSPDGIRYLSEGFDIGGHTWHHVDLTRVSTGDAAKEIVECRDRLQEICGREIFSFCYPRGKFNKHVVSLVQEAGFAGARTTRLVARAISDPYRMGVTATASDWRVAGLAYQSLCSKDLKFFGYMLTNGLFSKRWDQIAVQTLDFIAQNGGIWHLFGHSWEIDQSGAWAALEGVFRKVGGLTQEAVKLDNSQLLTKYAETRLHGPA